MLSRRGHGLLLLGVLGCVSGVAACGGDDGRRSSEPEREPVMADVARGGRVPEAAAEPTASVAGAGGERPAEPAVSPGASGAAGGEAIDRLPTHQPPSPDPPLAPPACGGALAPGEMRAVVNGVIGRLAIDEHGNAYAPSATEVGELALTALDPCGQPLWQRVVAPQLPDLPVAARLPGDDEVVLEALLNFRWDESLWRFDRSGEALAPYAPRGAAYHWVAATAAGVFLSTYDDDTSFLSQLMPDGQERRIDVDQLAPEYGIPVREDECAAYGSLIACFSGTFDTRDGDVLWNDRADELIDGGNRHVANPASDGERLYSFVYGTSSYRLVASSLASGERLWTRELGPSRARSHGVVTGAPVIGADGLVYVYFAFSTERVTRNVGDIIETVVPSEHFGWLIAFDRDGEERWRFEAPHDGFSQYDEHATHVAGSDGAIYLATAHGVFAIDAQSGALRWQRSALLPRLWTPRLALSPNGDLLVQFNDDQLVYLATEAHGTADSPWPAPGGDRRNLNAR